MPEWLATGLIAGLPAVVGVAVAWGMLSNRVSHLERAQQKFVELGVYNAERTATLDLLKRIEADIRRLLARVDRETTGSHVRTPRDDEEG